MQLPCRFGLLNYPFAGCHGLRYLKLSANLFTGRLPELAPCSQVTTLDVSWNRMSGALPAWLVATAPANLTYLSIARNNFTGDVSGCRQTWSSKEKGSSEDRAGVVLFFFA